MRPHYHHISDDDRLVMDSMLASGATQTAVALALGVHRSSICRERKRGLIADCGRYFGLIAQRTRKARRDAAALSRRKLDPAGVSPYWKLVLPYLHLGWSPQQICGRLRNNSSAIMMHGFSRRRRTVRPCLRRPLIADQGTEVPLHQDLAKRLRMDIHL